MKRGLAKLQIWAKRVVVKYERVGMQKKGMDQGNMLLDDELVFLGGGGETSGNINST